MLRPDPRKRFRGMGARGKPRGRRAKDDSRYQGQGEGKRQDHQGRHGADGKKVGAMERQSEQQARRGHRHQQSGNAAADGEQDAFRESLRDDLPPRGAKGQAHAV